MRQVELRKLNKSFNMQYIDMREVLHHLGISFTETGKNVSIGWIGTTCPFPGCDDHSNHLGISLSEPSVSCFKCGKSGTYLTYLGYELGSFAQATEVLVKFTPRELRKKEDSEIESLVTHVDLPKEATMEPSKYHTAYLKDRGFNIQELIDMYDLRFCGPIGKWANRIIVPVYRHGRLITFTSVDISEETLIRYKHQSIEKSIIHCKNYLYGLDQIPGDIIMVVEGYFDKLRIGPGCTCTFGTKVTRYQKKLISNYKKSIIVFDGDKDGWRSGEKLANDLATFQEVELITLEEGQDPDSLPDEDIKELKRMLQTRW